MTRILRPSLMALLLVTPYGWTMDGAVPTVEQQKADTAQWEWSDHYANLLYCVAHHLEDYEVRVVRPTGATWARKPFRIEVLDNGVEACSFRGHDETVFTQIGDVLYVADFSPIATGCSLVAFDLKGRKQLWKCQLKGNPPLMHSRYRHQVNITTDGHVIVVYGKESNGRYIEYVDTKTGKTVGHKKLPPSEKSEKSEKGTGLVFSGVRGCAG